MGKKKFNHWIIEHWEVGNYGKPRKGYKKPTYGVGQINIIASPTGGSTVNNPFSANGSVQNCAPGTTPTVIVWLTDADGNQTFGTAACGVVGQDGKANWNTTPFPVVQDGDYSFTAQVQTNGTIESQTIDVTIAN